MPIIIQKRTDKLIAKLIEFRQKHFLSQNDVAKILGVNKSVVSYWECGKRHPSYRMAARLQKMLSEDFSDNPAE